MLLLQKPFPFFPLFLRKFRPNFNAEILACPTFVLRYSSDISRGKCFIISAPLSAVEEMLLLKDTPFDSSLSPNRWGRWQVCLVNSMCSILTEFGVKGEPFCWRKMQSHQHFSPSFHLPITKHLCETKYILVVPLQEFFWETLSTSRRVL